MILIFTLLIYSEVLKMLFGQQTVNLQSLQNGVS